MGVSADLPGRTFAATPPYEVGREKLREFVAAIGADPGDPGAGVDEAPPTFAIVVAFGAMQALIGEPDVGVALHRVVHGDQRFVHARPIRAGDVLTATLTVETLRQVGGADVIGTRTDIATTAGEHVCTAYATLVHRAADSAA